MAKLKSGTRIYGTATVDTSVAVGSGVTITSNGIQVTGVSTFYNGPVLIGSGTSTGTANQVLQIAGINSSVYIGGNIGIGTTNPTSKLTVQGDVLVSGVVTANSYRGDGSLLSGVSGGVSISTNTTNTNQYIPFATSFGSTTGFGATTLLVYNPSSGNLGIGTTNPTSKLQVVGDGRFTGVVTATTFIGALTGIASTATNVIGGIGSLSQLQVTGVSTFSNGPVLIGSGTSTGTSGQVLQIAGINSSVYIGGNIGIGTTIPTSKLQVVGDVRVSGVVTALQLDLTANATANDSVLQLSGTPSGTSSTNGLLGIGTLNFNDTDIIADFTHSVNSYAQLVVQNKNSGSTASADIIVNNDRTGGTSYYGDFGVNSTTFSGVSPFNDPDGVYVISSNGSLTLGSITLNPVKIATNNVERLRVTETGNVGIGTTNPTQALDVVGNIVASGTVTASSDEKLKTNVRTIENALEKVLSLRGVEYDRIDTLEHQIGVIAQEIEKIIPEVVYPKPPAPSYETKSVAYANLVGLLIEAIKEQNIRIEELERRLGEL
jgi:hypothetical protein